jgi:ABC-type polysaccharide/polyol phosphate transport system ATPase subunit
MPASVITFDHVWKKFRRGQRHNSLRDLIPAMGRKLVARRPPGELQEQEFWAVRDMSFQVVPGQALGLIGPNGAGKSTALKLLTKILRPTRGSCEIKGRAGTLIEVAAGFHPDLTGRENVFLQGAIMGMSRAEIDRKLDAVVDFSGLHDFIDTQVKRYSSGMNARLGFSIAANLEPNALIIDEVLAVGDMVFQQRCLDRMREFKRQGVAIVFVSHNLQAVGSLCDHALWIHGGVKGEGRPADVIQAYALGATDEGERHAKHDEPVQITGVRLMNDRGDRVESPVAPGASLTLRVSYLPREAVEEAICDVLVYRSADNMLLYEGHFSCREFGLPGTASGQPFVLDFQFRANLASGDYRVTTRLRDTIMRRFLAEACPPSFFTVSGPAARNAIGYLDFAPAAVNAVAAPSEVR